MKNISFYSLIVFSLMVSVVHASDVAVTTQIGSYSAVSAISQSGDANYAQTTQYANNPNATDNASVLQAGYSNSAYITQDAYDTGYAIGNNDGIIQDGTYNSASIYTQGEGNTTQILQNNSYQVSSTYTQGSNNNVAISQSGDAYYGGNQAYSSIINAYENNVTIAQGQNNFATSANYASSVITESAGNNVGISQDGDYNTANVNLYNAFGNDIYITQNGYNNTAYASIDTGNNNQIHIEQTGTGHYADASLVLQDNKIVNIIQQN